MKILCRKYVQFFIALLMMTAIQGKFLICTTYEAFTSKHVDTIYHGESSSDEADQKDFSLKSLKKLAPELDSEFLMPAASGLSLHPVKIPDPAFCKELLPLYKKVPTQPPLL